MLNTCKSCTYIIHDYQNVCVVLMHVVFWLLFSALFSIFYQIESALHVAVASDNKKIVELLLNANAAIIDKKKVHTCMNINHFN